MHRGVDTTLRTCKTYLIAAHAAKPERLTAMQLRTYVEAKALVGTKTACSSTNGMTKYLTWQQDGPVIKAVLHDTAVAVFGHAGVQVRTGGRLTPTTFDGIARALKIGRGGRWCGTEKRIAYVAGVELRENLFLDYDGNVLDQGIGDVLATAPRGGR